MNVYIYSLNTIGGPVRYIGKTVKPSRRLLRHRRDSRDFHKSRWIRKIGPSNVFMTILCRTTDEPADEVERQFIKLAKENGCDLTNGTEGGTGGPLSPESILKLRRTKTGKKRGLFTQAHRKNISTAALGKKKPWLVGNTNGRGYKHTEEWKIQQSERMKGNTHNRGRKPPTMETLRLLSAAAKKRWVNTKG